MPLRKIIKNFLYGRILPYLGIVIIKLISLTYRITVLDGENEKSVLEKGLHPIYASWHQRFFPGISFFNRRKPIAIIVSLSRDGDLISKIIELMGWHAVRGSSSRGGFQALRDVRKLANEGYSLGHIVDGPRGPFGIVKPGIVTIARLSGMPILPTIISAKSKWTFESWDKFILPKPFSKIKIKFGMPVYLNSRAEKKDMDQYRHLLEEQLKKQYAELDRSWE